MQEQTFIRRVLVVDDESIIRYLLVNLLENLGFECHSAASAIEAIKLVRKFDPDVAICDLDLGPGASGAELIAAMRLESPALGVVLLSNFLPKKTEQLSLDRVTYLHKSELQSAEVLRQAIDDCVGASGDAIAAPSGGDAGKIQSLTSRQQHVLEKISHGASNADIAADLGIGMRAVERTVTRIFLKLGLNERPVGSRRVEAARLYLLTVGAKR